MIDYYYSIPELNTKDCIQECINYYQGRDLSYDEYYGEYDKINSLKKSIEYNDKNIFFKKNKRLKIENDFMKCCHLEAIKRCIELNAEKDSKDSNSDLNKEINDYKEDFEYYPDIFEEDISDKLLAKEELRRHVQIFGWMSLCRPTLTNRFLCQMRTIRASSFYY